MTKENNLQKKERIIKIEIKEGEKFVALWQTPYNKEYKKLILRWLENQQ